MLWKSVGNWQQRIEDGVPFGIWVTLACFEQPLKLTTQTNKQQKLYTMTGRHNIISSLKKKWKYTKLVIASIRVKV